jgi:hypothetical protein
MAANNRRSSNSGALSKDPSTKPDKFVKPKTRKYRGVWVDPQGYKVDGYGRRLSGQTKPFAPPTETNKPTKNPNVTKDKDFRNLSQNKQIGELGTDALAYGNLAFKKEQERLAAGQPDFSDQLESARQNVMGQFERTMGPEFERQQMQLRQRMAEQGIDPNSGAYQAQMKMLNDSQNNARQNAMSQAFTQGAEYEQQGFTQDVTGRLLPFQIGQMTSEAWKLPFAARTEAEQKELDRQAAIQQARISGGATVGAARENAAAARDVAAAQNMDRYNPVKKPNIGSSFATGLGAGAGTAGTNWALK